MNANNSSSIVYVVDDDISIRDALTLLIESANITVRSFESALDFLKNYNPDLPCCLLLDINMPKMNGHELQAELISRNIKIPIIFISGEAQVNDPIKAFRNGAVNFLEKPFDHALVLKNINEAIRMDTEYKKDSLNKNLIQKNIDKLTAREKDVLNLIVKNYSNKEAAKILNISNRTVEVHRCRVMEKMHADNIIDLLIKIIYCKSSGASWFDPLSERFKAIISNKTARII